MKTSESLWLHYRDEPALNNNNIVTDFSADSNNSISLKFDQQLTGKTENNEIKDFKIKIPLKYLSNFWRTLAMPLTNCEISLILIWLKNYF